MTPRETRFVLLVGLAWKLRRLAVGSYIALPGKGETVLHVRGDNYRLSVLAAQYEERWYIIWSPGAAVRAEDLDLAARQIARLVWSRRAA